jgi:hypothetical protein
VCRLFGMSGAPRRVRATFWLLDAPDSLAVQSRREPDGTGLGHFAEDGTPQVHRCPLAAYEDRGFAAQAREVASRTFVAHVRFASTGAAATRNTHPFEQRGRLFAHNGVVEGLDALDRELGDHRSLVRGETDSERVFALVTRRSTPAATSQTASPGPSAGSPPACPSTPSTSSSSPPTSCGRCATRSATSCSCSSAPPAVRTAIAISSTPARPAASASARATSPPPRTWSAHPLTLADLQSHAAASQAPASGP